MTVSEAFKQVSDALTEIGLTDDGEALTGLEAAGVVAVHHGDAWADVEDAFAASVITPDEYVERITDLIEEFKRDRFRIRFERRIVSLRADYRELA